MSDNVGSNTSMDQKLSEMQNQLDQAFEINSNKVKDMIRLKDYLQDLKIDFGVLTMNKIRSRTVNQVQNDFFEGMGDSDKMVLDQINNTIDNLAKIIEANIKSDNNGENHDDSLMF